MKRIVITGSLIALFTIASALALTVTMQREQWGEAQNDPVFYNELGYHYAQAGEMGAAQAAFQHAVELDGSYENARKNLYVAAFGNGAYDIAIANLRVLHEADGASEQYAFDLAQALVMHARVQATDANVAVSELQEALMLFDSLGSYAHAAENAQIVRTVLANAAQ